jgi:hemerythrin-like domain-containing protein
MNRSIITEQTKVENELLEHLLDGLRTTLSLEVRSPDVPRQLSTVRFLAQCLQRHLDRLMALEECDGYMDVVTAAVPQMGKAVDALRHEHEAFRLGTSQLVHRLERVSASDAAGFATICQELRSLLQRLDAHGEKEVALVQEAMDREGGGEG